MRLVFGLLVALAVPFAQTLPPAGQPISAGSKVWVGRYAEYESFLASAPIERIEGINLGVTSPHHVFFGAGGLAAGAAWKPLAPGKYEGFFESYRSEIAAYKLDRLLELDMVPPTVERSYRSQKGSLQLWVEDTRMMTQIVAQKLQAPNAEAWNVQVARQRAFDDLTANTDDNKGNMLIDRAWNLVLIDHSRAFTATLEQPFQLGKTLTRIDRPFFDRLKALDRAVLDRELGPLLEARGVSTLVARRDAIVKGLQKLAAERGDAKVFTPSQER